MRKGKAGRRGWFMGLWVPTGNIPLVYHTHLTDKISRIALGLGLYIIGDVKHAVQRRVAAKCRKVLLAEGLLDGHVDRISRRSHSALRYGVQDLVRRYDLVLEEAQRERLEGEKVAKEASEGRRYYKALGRRIRELEEVIRSVDTAEKKIPLSG